MISDFTMSGFSQARSLLGDFRFQMVANRWAAAAEPMALDAVRREAPVSKGAVAGRTKGKKHLRDSLRARRHVTALSVGIDVISDAPHARYVVSGTKPHLIAPRNARALYWVVGGGGHFARLVHHPGTKPNPFAKRAMRRLEPLLVARFEAEVVRALKVR